MTKPLSPAAQAVLDEYSAAADFTFDPSIDFWGVKAGLAAALRALAVRINGADAIRQDILDIAEELEGAVLARWGHPQTLQPVAVSERLPGPEDCLDEGWAWFFNQRIGWRQAVLPVSPGYTHWLPANALPTPESTND